MSPEQLEREKWVMRYLSALDSADAEDLLVVLKHAEADAELSNMIAEVHATYEAMSPDVFGNYQPTKALQPTFSPNGKLHTPADLTQWQIGFNKQNPRKVLRGYLSMGIVAMLSLVLIGVILFNRQTSSSGLTPQTLSLDSLQQISANNINDLTQLTVLGNGAVNDASWSPDGTTIAVATSRGIYLHSADDLSLEPILLGGQINNVLSVAYTPDGTAIAGATGNRVVLWSAQTGEVLREFVPDGAESVYEVMIKPDGTAIGAVVCMERNENRACEPVQLFIWDIATGAVLNTVSMGVSYSPVLNRDWTLLADIGAEWGDVDIYEVATGEILTTLADDDVNLTVFDFSTDGDGFLVIGWATGGVSRMMMWDIDDLLAGNVMFSVEPIAQIRSPDNFIPQLIFQTRGTRVFTISYNAVHMWDWATNELTAIVDNTGTSSLSRLVVQPDGEQIMTISQSGVLQIWDVSSGEQLSQSLRYGGRYYNLDFHQTLPYLTASHGYFAPGVLRLWNYGEDPISEQTFTGYDGDLVVYDGAISPDGEAFAYLGANIVAGVQGSGQRIWLRDLETGEDSSIINSANGGVTFANDGTFLAINRGAQSGATTANIFRYMLGDEEATRVQISGGYFNIISDDPFAFSPDGRLLAVNVCNERVSVGAGELPRCAESVIRLYDAITGALIAFLADSGRVYDSSELVFSRDGQYIALNQCVTISPEPVAYRGTCDPNVASEVLVWDISEVYDLLGQDQAIEDTPEDTPSLSIPSVYRVEFPPNDYPYRFTYAPLLINVDGGLLLLASDNDHVYIWLLSSDRTTELLRTLDMSGYSLALNPDGTLIAVGQQGTVTLWGIPQ